MKNLLILLLSFLSFAVLPSCDKDDDPQPQSQANVSNNNDNIVSVDNTVSNEDLSNVTSDDFSSWVYEAVIYPYEDSDYPTNSYIGDKDTVLRNLLNGDGFILNVGRGFGTLDFYLSEVLPSETLIKDIVIESGYYNHEFSPNWVFGFKHMDFFDKELGSFELIYSDLNNNGINEPNEWTGEIMIIANENDNVIAFGNTNGRSTAINIKVQLQDDSWITLEFYLYNYLK
jgi:hypothetical protein